MNIQPINTLDRLIPLLDGLGTWHRYAIWIGDGVLEAYLTAPGASGWHVPREAAFLLQLPSIVEQYQWEILLQDKGWNRMTETDTGFIRFGLDGHTALVSPLPGGALATQSRWMEDACFHAIRIPVSTGRKLSLLAPPYLVATTLDQLPSSETDLRYSDAFARLGWLFAGREEVVTEVRDSFYEVREYIRAGLARLLTHPDLMEALLHVFSAQEWFLSETAIERMKLVSASQNKHFMMMEA